MEPEKKYIFSQQELEEELGTQLHLLQKAVSAFDEGDSTEVRNIAGRLRLLLKDKGSSISLLGQLKRKTAFLNTAFESKKPANLNTAHYGLVGIPVGLPYNTPIPHFNTSPSQSLDFERWWNMPVIIDMKGNSFSRGDLIHHLAEQAGGVHADPGLDMPYAELTKFNSLGLSQKKDGGEWEVLKGAETASLRQIAYEVLSTLGVNSPIPKIKGDGYIIGGIVSANFEPSYKASRNDPCPCGSGKKFKKCHGA